MSEAFRLGIFSQGLALLSDLWPTIARSSLGSLTRAIGV